LGEVLEEVAIDTAADHVRWTANRRNTNHSQDIDGHLRLTQGVLQHHA
jgi:hypothetical protein